MATDEIALGTIPVDSAPRLPPRIPRAPYRHAAPSGPWPWQSLDDNIPESSNCIEHTHDNSSKECAGCHWSLYPENRFPNWKKDQVERGKIKHIQSEGNISTIYHIEVAKNGIFLNPSEREVYRVSNKKDSDKLVEDPSEPRRVRVFCVDNLTVPVMQMLGTKYNIEPFFWTSSVNWIPSRYQENPHRGSDDHITITLKFAREVKLASLSAAPFTNSQLDLKLGQIIDTQMPLALRTRGKEGLYNENVLITDFLAIHMYRAKKNSTIITYHHTPEWNTTSAKTLHTRIGLVGQSVYWQKIFEKTEDPTFVLLATLWYALYSWDEAFETLWDHISQLELQVIDTHDMSLTQELHKIRAHLLHYASLLEDFHESVLFVKTTPNPAMGSPEYSDQQRSDSRDLLNTECGNLLTQINRLKISREMWDKRLENAMHLVFSSVNIEDSKRMQELTRAAVRDSAAMKQLSYLTMVFLPASFAANVFGMNIQEINPGTGETLPRYIISAFVLTAVSTWILVACQASWGTTGSEPMIKGVIKRLLWPVQLLLQLPKLTQPRRGEHESDLTLTQEDSKV